MTTIFVPKGPRKPKVEFWSLKGYPLNVQKEREYAHSFVCPNGQVCESQFPRQAWNALHMHGEMDKHILNLVKETTYLKPGQTDKGKDSYKENFGGVPRPEYGLRNINEGLY